MQNIRLEDLIRSEQLQQHMPQLRSYFEKGGTWQELAGFSHSQLEEHYQHGHDHYLAGRYVEAHDAFLALTILNPYEMRYWFALGAASFEQGEFEQAAAAYVTSHSASESDPLPLFHAARSYLRLGEPQQAREILEVVEELAVDDRLRRQTEELLGEIG